VSETPKPLLEVAGEPFLLHQLRLLASYDATKVVLCVGYLGDAIVERIGHERFGIEIAYSFDTAALAGTLGAIRLAADKLGDRFLVLYGDTYLRVDYQLVAGQWIDGGLPAMMVVLRNEGRWDVSNAEFDGSRVTCYDKRSPSSAMQWIDYGLGGLTRAVVDAAGEHESDLAALYATLAASGRLAGFVASERFYEIGTPEALAETEAFLGASASAGGSSVPFPNE
jgi:NDP-sugar pyrophosphorylase family protein